MKLEGKAHKFGDNVNTDEIIPARYLNTSNPKDLAKHCMEDIDKEFGKKVQKGDILVAGKNFGCGSSREHAPIAIKESGVSCVIAKSFAAIFFRNSINIGLPVLECTDTDKIKSGALLKVDLATGEITNLNTKGKYKTVPFPPFLQNIIESGGLMGWIKKSKKG
ncbi:MAG: 3-isopropylmalate dehydratase small subunit [Candidatus Omnitrophica bacterium CG07_land_8_20_14_0_80_42_15]|uniref:3-isopropylmalate dehydratase small subunit n=1 Tax=Candidatus Aquitaenariimonas noxiae TaxID=1974741 RepID=A0A2J0KUV8_9BACT|nr:MAG: 3-isopropylmalate dehydratase small subunit [Candidatus Omnitrophica bacterium CG07_land_8_20_14_0_80_42_15]